MVRTLVIDTATAACSVALIADGEVVDFRHEVVGRGHAERLVPMIAELADGGRAGAILVDCGPGSFTGIRVGIAAARGLGIGWGVPVTGFSSTTLIAAMAMRDHGASDLAVVSEGGHGEVFVQIFRGMTAGGPLASLTPEGAIAEIGSRPAFGNGVRYVGTGIDVLPDARYARFLPDSARALPPSPIYGRAPDAKPMAAAP